jgi:hypothetical protein
MNKQNVHLVGFTVEIYHDAWSHERQKSCLHLLPRLSSLLSFLQSRVLKAVPTQDVTNPVSLLSFYYMKAVPVLLDCI